MTSVVRRDNESIEDALKRFKRELRKVGVLREARKHEHYEKPSEIKKRKKAASACNRNCTFIHNYSLVCDIFFFDDISNIFCYLKCRRGRLSPSPWRS